jgi:hypothetical protein
VARGIEYFDKTHAVMSDEEVPVRVSGHTVELTATRVRQRRKDPPTFESAGSHDIKCVHIDCTAVVDIKHATVRTNEKTVGKAEVRGDELERISCTCVIDLTGSRNGIIVWSWVGEIDSAVAIECEVVRVSQFVRPILTCQRIEQTAFGTKPVDPALRRDKMTTIRQDFVPIGPLNCGPLFGR